MKKKLLNALTTVILFLTTTISYGQAPTLGVTSSFAIFTATGAINNGGASNITGDIGSYTTDAVGFPGSGVVTGTIYTIGVPILTTAAANVATAYSELFNLTCDSKIGTTLGNGQILPPKVYCLGGASTLNGTLTLDGKNNPNSIFVFKIVGGALSTSVSAAVSLINMASACNVYWQVGGAFSLEDGSVFKGTVIADGAIDLKSASTLTGRALSTGGFIATSATTVIVPSGCSGTAPLITIEPVNDTACVGVLANFTVVATGTDLTYQWRKGTTNLVNGGNISGATSATLTINTVHSGNAATNYNVVVSGLIAPPATSINAVLVVNPLATASVIAAGGPITFCEGGSVVLSGNVSGTWSNAGTTATKTITTAGDYYVTNTNGCGSVNSNHIVVTVNPLPTASVITAGGPITFCEGGNVVLSGNVSGTWSNAGTTATKTIANAGDYYVTNTNGCGSVNSNHIIVAVNSLPNANTGNDTMICKGLDIILGTSAITGNTYLWKANSSLSSTIISNPVANPLVATTYTLTEKITATGCQKTNTVIISLHTTPVITSEPMNNNACEGSPTNFSVISTGSNLTYQWRNGTVNLVNGGSISGATTSTLSINPVSIVNATSNYNVVVTATCTDTSNDASLVVIPNIVMQPNNQLTTLAGSVSYSVIANGTNLSYQWRNGTTNLANTGNITGANTATLTINNVTINDTSTHYNVVVNGTCESTSISANASLWICSCVIGTPVYKALKVIDVVSVYPDPFSTQLNIVINTESAFNNCEFLLYNVLGEELFNINITKQITTISTLNLWAGVYIYKVINNNSTIQTGKIISE